MLDLSIHITLVYLLSVPSRPSVTPSYIRLKLQPHDCALVVFCPDVTNFVTSCCDMLIQTTVLGAHKSSSSVTPTISPAQNAFCACGGLSRSALRLRTLITLASSGNPRSGCDVQ